MRVCWGLLHMFNVGAEQAEQAPHDDPAVSYIPSFPLWFC